MANPRADRASVSTLADYTNLVEGLGPGWLYRGQAKSEWELLPSVLRTALGQEPAVQRQATEIAMLERFKRESRPYIGSLPGERDDWRWLALAQHFGMPTRLLDWSENPLTALFFAVENPNGAKDSAVWLSQRPQPVQEEFPPFHIDRIGLFDPPHIAGRIAAQKGCFTAHPLHYMEAMFEWPGQVKVVRIPAAKRVALRRSLQALGIDRSTLFPELEGVALAITRRFCAPADER